MRVLLIEDDEGIRDVFKLLLEAEGPLPDLCVELASSGASGLESAQRLKPDLVLLDLTLPGEDGFEVLTKLKALENTREVPVVAFTAHSGDIMRKRVAEAGFAGLVTKPVDFEAQLFPLLRQLLGDRVSDRKASA